MCQHLFNMSPFPKTAEEFLTGQILLIDKPLGWTSFDLVKKTKNLIRTKYNLKKIKVGHAGTLDPLATGLLIVCTGKFTKRISEIQEQNKVYTGEITLGGTTPSYDLETEVNTQYETSHITKKLIQDTALLFTGVIDQKSPIFSALKRDGERLYEKARRGESIEIEARKVSVHSFKITSILVGLFLGWAIFLLIFPDNELKEFFSNTFEIFSSIEIINQLPYPSPLSEENARATKTLIYFTLAGALTIYSCFTKNNKISNKLKIFFIFLYVASLISFKYGLGRSDASHIQSSTGLLLVVFSSLTLYYFFNLLNYLKFNLFLLNLKKINFVLILLIIFLQFDLYKLNHIVNFPDKLRTLIYAEDKEFLINNF